MLLTLPYNVQESASAFSKVRSKLGDLVGIVNISNLTTFAITFLLSEYGQQNHMDNNSFVQCTNELFAYRNVCNASSFSVKTLLY